MYRLITTVFTIIDTHIEKDTLLTELNLSVLPDLHGHFVKLTEYVVSLVAIPCSTSHHPWREFRRITEISLLATAAKQRQGQDSDC